MSKITLLKSETADKLIAGVRRPKPPTPTEKVTRGKGGQSPTSTLMVEIVASTGDGYYTVKRSNLNNDDADTANHTWQTAPNNVEFEAREITGDTGATVGETYRIWSHGSTLGKVVWLFQLGGGGGLTYIEITASTDPNTYTATSFDNPVDRNVIEEELTVKAIQHTNGTLPVTSAGKGYFASTSGGVLYIQPSIMAGV